MDKEVCIDTNICIEIIKENKEIRLNLSIYIPFNAVISAISVFELYLRKSNLNVVDEFVKMCKVIQIDEQIAKKASEVYKENSKLGHIIDFRDALIAATCITHNLELVTLNKKDFEYVKELKLLKI